MNIKNIKILKSDERGIVYECSKAMFVIRKKGTVTADHVHVNIKETIFLFKGDIKLTVGSEVEKLKAPIKFEIPKGAYHKIVALSDIEFLKV